MQAFDAAKDAKAIAEATRERIHAEFREFERRNSAQHEAASTKIDGLREHISLKIGELHKRIDRLVILMFSAVIGLLVSVVAWLVEAAPPWRSL